MLIYIVKTKPVRILLGAYALFEAWHAFSHIKHIPGNAQTNVVHVLGYMMAFATLFAIVSLSKMKLSPIFIKLLAYRSLHLDLC